MNTWIALLRGINVGGKNILPMKDLRAIVERLGYENIRTYIQSGNCVFDSANDNPDRLADTLSEAINKHAGFQPSVCVLTAKSLKGAIAVNPFSVDDANLKNVHLFFLMADISTFDEAALKIFATQGEQFHLVGRVFYLWTPNGIGRSKLAEKISKLIPVEMTARNLRSAIKIAALAEPKS